MARSIELEQHHRKTGNKDALAEALAGQGRFVEAVQVVERPDLKAVLEEKIEAVLKDDADCACATYNLDGEYHLPNQHIESYAYSEKHKTVMPFIRCRICNTLNAMPVLGHLAEQQAVRRSDAEPTDFFTQPR